MAKKAFEFRDLSEEQLEERIVEQGENLMTMRMQLGARTLDSPVGYRDARRELARMKTVLVEKRRAAKGEK